MRPPESWRRARATLAIAGAAVLAWLIPWLFGFSEIAVVWGGFIPARVEGMDGDGALAPVFLTPLTATMIHGGFIHLAFNLLILLFCGRAVENILGPAALVVLFVSGAYSAAALHYAVMPGDVSVMIGASGAVSAILGAYALLFGRNRVKIANPRLALWVNALWLLAAWIALQLLVGFTFRGMSPGIAFIAHIGGFLPGLLLVKPLLLLRYRKA